MIKRLEEAILNCTRDSAIDGDEVHEDSGHRLMGIQ